MPAKHFDAAAVNRLLAERPISLISLAPTMLTRLLDAKTQPWNPRLRLVLLGGEATPVALVSRCIEAGIPIAPSYGLSEAASQVATATPDLLQTKPASVGKPLLFTELRVLDERGNDAALGKPGEIIIRGPQLMRGYYNDPAATKKALRSGWLHTGDIGYLDEDGDLVVLQRREDLIVSGGENIYPAEVENALREHPAVEEVIVIDCKMQNGDKGSRRRFRWERVAAPPKTKSALLLARSWLHTRSRVISVLLVRSHAHRRAR